MMTRKGDLEKVVGCLGRVPSRRVMNLGLPATIPCMFRFSGSLGLGGSCFLKSPRGVGGLVRTMTSRKGAGPNNEGWFSYTIQGLRREVEVRRGDIFGDTFGHGRALLC